MALDMEKIKERLAALDNKGSGGNSPYFRPSEGDQDVRIVPTKDEDPFKDFFMHYGVGKSRPFLCPKRNFGEECAVCEFASHLWRDSKEANDEAGQKLAKKLFAKQRFFSPVLVRGEEDKGVRWWGYSETVSRWLLKKTLNPEYGDITDPKKGFDLTLTYEKEKGKFFPTTTLETKRLPSELCKEMTKEECKKILDSVPDINDLLDRKTPQQVQAALESMSADSINEEEANDIKEDVKKYDNKEKSPVDSVDAAFDQMLKE